MLVVNSTDSGNNFWPALLNDPPTVLHCNFGIHGSVSHERYRLDGLWCIHLYRYVGEAVIDGQTFPIRDGYVSVTPPNTDLEHRWLHPRSEHISIHFKLEGTSGEAELPAMQDLGGDFAELYKRMESAIQWFPQQRRRTECAVWEALWQISDARTADPANASQLHPAVQKTLQSIEKNLHEPLSVATLATASEISHNHLTHLFHRQVGQTIAGYIVNRRTERAKYLLTYSTLPIKAIAVQVGLLDLQVFNKTIRRKYGSSPRHLRGLTLSSETQHGVDLNHVEPTPQHSTRR